MVTLTPVDRRRRISVNSAVERAWSARTQWIGNFAAVCIFSLVGLTLTALCLALAGFEELVQTLAATG